MGSSTMADLRGVIARRAQAVVGQADAVRLEKVQAKEGEAHRYRVFRGDRQIGLVSSTQTSLQTDAWRYSVLGTGQWVSGFTTRQEAVDSLVGRLKPKQARQKLYFHASPYRLPVGTKLVPGGPGGGSRVNESYQEGFEWKADWVWLTTSGRVAYEYALKVSIDKGSAHIYLARPTSPVKSPENNWFEDSFITEGAQIVAAFPHDFETLRTGAGSALTVVDGKEIWFAEGVLLSWKDALERGVDWEPVYKLAPSFAQGVKVSTIPAKLYHGTNQVFVSGDTLRPAALSGNAVFDTSYTHYDPYYVYLSDQQHLAERYAKIAARKRGGEPHVYEVRPIGSCFRDPEFEATGFGSDQWVATMGEIIRELPIE